jgi:hypothetical protein
VAAHLNKVPWTPIPDVPAPANPGLDVVPGPICTLEACTKLESEESNGTSMCMLGLGWLDGHKRDRPAQLLIELATLRLVLDVSLCRAAISSSRGLEGVSSANKRGRENGGQMRCQFYSFERELSYDNVCGVIFWLAS